MRPKLSAAHKAARRRMSNVTPENCGKVLARSSYWTRHFLDLYLDRCDEAGLHLPADGYLLAQQAPELAARIRIGEVPGEFKTEADKLSARVTALAVLGSCCRSVEKLREAELAIKWAQDLAVGARLTPKAGCELVRRQAVLKWSQGAPDAEAWIDHAVEMAERLEELPNLADALVLRGTYLAKLERGGVEDVARGMSIASLKDTRGRRTFDAAMFNISKRAVRSGDRAAATGWLSKVKKRMARFPRSIQKVRASWVEALFSADLGSIRYGVRLLEKARRNFIELNAPEDFLLCSMDLIGVHFLDAEFQEAHKIIESTLRELEALGSCGAWATELAPLLESWKDVGDSAASWEHCRAEMTETIRGTECAEKKALSF